LLHAAARRPLEAGSLSGSFFPLVTIRLPGFYSGRITDVSKSFALLWMVQRFGVFSLMRAFSSLGFALGTSMAVT